MTDDIFTIGLEKDQSLARCTLHVLRTMTHKVATMSGSTFNFAAGRDAKTLLGAAVGFEFGHFYSS